MSVFVVCVESRLFLDCPLACDGSSDWRRSGVQLLPSDILRTLGAGNSPQYGADVEPGILKQLLYVQDVAAQAGFAFGKGGDELLS